MLHHPQEQARCLFHKELIVNFLWAVAPSPPIKILLTVQYFTLNQWKQKNEIETILVAGVFGSF